jgi:hypothetical protein
MFRGKPDMKIRHRPAVSHGDTARTKPRTSVGGSPLLIEAGRSSRAENFSADPKAAVYEASDFSPRIALIEAARSSRRPDSSLGPKAAASQPQNTLPGSH